MFWHRIQPRFATLKSEALDELNSVPMPYWDPCRLSGLLSPPTSPEHEQYGPRVRELFAAQTLQLPARVSFSSVLNPHWTCRIKRTSGMLRSWTQICISNRWRKPKPPGSSLVRSPYRRVFATTVYLPAPRERSWWAQE